MILIRYFLIGLIVYLIVRTFIRFGDTNGSSGPKDGKNIKNGPGTKKVSKAVGEYIDYEEIKK